MKRRIERNRPVVTLLKEFSGPDKGKKRAARLQLHKRFDSLDYRHQIKFLSESLESTKNDRLWAYIRLVDYWEPCFIAPVLKLWETYHEPRCSWALIRYFPKEYIIEHLDELISIPRNYYFICLRFGREDDFNIDKTKLAPYDLIRMSYKIGLQLSNYETIKCLFSIIEQACKTWDYTIDIENYIEFTAGDDRFVSFGKDNLPILEYAYYYVSKMGMSDVIHYLDTWIDKVNVYLGKDIEWISLNQLVLKDSSFNDRALNILKRIILRLISEYYGSQINDKHSK